MANKKINQLDTRTGAALTDLILIGDPTSGTSFKLTATAFRTLLNNVPYTGATTNVNLGAFNLTAESIIKSGGTSSQFLKADGSVDSSTYTPTSRTLTINGTSFDLSADRSWTIAAGITGSGTSGQVAYWNGTSSQTGSNNLFWDAANSRLGINTTSPIRALDIRGAARIETASTTELDLIGGGGNILRVSCSATTPFIGTMTSNPLGFFIGATERARFFTTGNFGINTGATDGGQRLQVMGDAFIRGTGTTSATTALLVTNSVGSTILQVRNDNYVLATNISTTSVFSTNYYTNGTGANMLLYGGSSGTTSSFVFNSYGSTDSAISNDFVRMSRVYNPTSGVGVYNTLLIGSTINQTGGANGITRGLYVNPTLTAAADWRAIEWSNSTGWGLYGAGTANNYLAGKLVTVR